MVITAYKRLDSGVQFYNLVFHEEAGKPAAYKIISIECDLQIPLTLS